MSFKITNTKHFQIIHEKKRLLKIGDSCVFRVIYDLHRTLCCNAFFFINIESFLLNVIYFYGTGIFCRDVICREISNWISGRRW